MPRLNTKTCIVTGAGRGIGAAIARAFAREGATVVGTDKDERSAADVAHEIGGEVMRLDVASEQDWEALAGAWPECDVMVNNAGITGFEEAPRPHDPETASLEDWRAVHAVNLDGKFLGCRFAIRAMRPRGAGAIINISSVVGTTGNAGQTNYAASKAGIVGFSKSLAKELGSRDVNVNVVAPGYVQTDMTDELDEDTRETILDAVPLDRLASPSEIADAVLFLASPAANYVTGHVLHVNGGLSM